eukprot:Skav222525  [mRNA]  locus=scaffold2875:50542:57914:+ [translate_table: standard]
MDRPLAVGAAGGSVSALLLKLVADAISSASAHASLLDCPLVDCQCPDISVGDIHLGPLDLKSVVVGVTIGLALGPLLDLFFVLRAAWRNWVTSRLREFSATLTLEVNHLRSDLSSVQQRLSDLEGRTPDTAFELVSSPRPGASAEERGAGYRVGAERESAARSIGQWIRRCLNRQPRGLSGRERISLRNRFYLVAQDFQNNRYNPPLVFETWARCQELVVVSGQPGDSIFVGLPSKEECRIAVREAGFKSLGVAESEQSVIVAVPDSAWHRTKSRRVLPEDALVRAVRVEVFASSGLDRAAVDDSFSLKIWLASLKPEYADLVIYGQDGAATTCFPVDSMGLPRLPAAEALVAVANDHFLFLSAESAAGLPQRDVQDVMEERVSKLEGNISEILECLKDLKGVKKTPASAKITPPQPTAPASQLGGPPGLDHQIAAQALAAGVSQNALAEISQVLARQTPQDPLVPPAAPEVNLDTSDEDELDQHLGTAAGSGSADPLNTAVMSLTKIISQMHKDRARQKQRGLDGILDRAEGGSARDASTSSSRSKAGALRSLQNLLHSNPKLLYEALEKNMQKDWEAAGQSLPGASIARISARGWIEAGSRVNAYQSSARPAWQFAGIWDSLMQGKVAEARARAALATAMYDQVCCDRGGASPSLRKNMMNTCAHTHTTGSSEPPSGVRSAGVAAMENSRSPLLTEEQKAALRRLPAECFILPGGRRASSLPDLCRKGVLDLYSGQSAVAKSLAKRFNVWVVTFDFEHGSNQNLLDPGLQRTLKELLVAGCFLGLGAAPECASFSRAVHPMVRSAMHPEGLQGISESMAVKVARGNEHARFLLELILICKATGVHYWVENPDGSFLWLLRGWSAAGIGSPENSFRFDMCRYKTAWRKRTRIATSTELAGRRELCRGDHSHVILRGRSKLHKCSWTRLAQVYPRAMAADVATAMGTGMGLCSNKIKLNIGGCAKCAAARIGEAANPGPRRAMRVPRDAADLQGVALVEPTTQLLQHKVWKDFDKWMKLQLSESAVEQAQWCPGLFALLLRSYGFYLYSTGHALYEFRHLLVVAQQRFSGLRACLQPAWHVVTKWEILQPVQHRRPLHFALYRAVVALGILRRWYRWAATVVLGFEGIARISEVLKAIRGDLILPSDQFSNLVKAAFLRVSNPKTKRRGKGKVQHLKLFDPVALPFLESVFGTLHGSLALFPGSAAAFRLRWDSLLEELKVPREQRPTPASIRGGGAIVAYQRGEPIQDIMWRMRVSSQTTLEHYLQEMAADSFMTRLPTVCKDKIRTAALLFPFLMEHPV